MMMKTFPRRNGPRDPKHAGGNYSGLLALSPQASIFPPPPLGHHPMVTSLLDGSKQPTPGLSGTQWSEDLSHKPSQHIEPPIPGPSPSSEPPEDVVTHEPEPEVAPTQSMEEPFDTPISPALTPQNSTPTPVPSPYLSPIAAENLMASSPPVTSSSHSYNDAHQEFTDLQPTIMIPQAIN
ncbi:hypothetical protein O181_052121 [Austropuccinia psidii MF-1]|uniref:Uncharacterized protein n=1 Tax=Austropuccinia psidii MF-1 TaxID=1389203 RepID=A0A9Q3E504_9BASI|nr:hypothetical protein [Austropuccinia psidii MF-1]